MSGTETLQKTRTRAFPVASQLVWITTGLAAITLLGAFLRLYQLGAYSIGNSYYAATVESMLKSWHNFFFVTFEPGGSVTVDKPPLGFWLQAISAYFLGVTGFALALPQALAGTFSIPLLYGLVKRPFGAWAGLGAALILAVAPVTIATERNNTIDGTLVFVLLLAAWAFLKATRQGRLRYVLLGVVLVGLGFNIKMIQAYMVLPALYAVYFLGAPLTLKRRAAHLVIATGLLLVVSLAWVVAVDLTPASQRPYVGGSTNNSMLELVVGHNGARRLGMMGIGPVGAGPGGPGSMMLPPPGLPPNAAALPGGQGQMPLLPPGAPGGGPPGGPGEVGQAGLLRLFTAPLAEEAGWLLPLALIGLGILGIAWDRSKLSHEQILGVILWAGWLLPMMGYFSFTPGLWHTYYLIMLGPAIAALVAMAGWALWRLAATHPAWGWSLMALFSMATLVYQGGILRQYPPYGVLVMIIAGTLWFFGAALPAWNRSPVKMSAPAVALLGVSLLVAPLTMSALTLFNTHPNVALPNAGPEQGNGPQGSNNDAQLSTEQQTLMNYLLQRTAPDSYLAATLDSHTAAPLILATGRPVLTFGGFTGDDKVINADQLALMVESGQLRYILGGQQLAQRKPEIGAWVSSRCQVVEMPGASKDVPASYQTFAGPGGPQSSATLYDCGL